VPAPGLSAKLIPYLLELLAFLTVLDVGAYMPPKIEIPEVVSMRDLLVEGTSREADEIVKAPQQALVELAQEKQRLFAAVRDGLADREALVAWSQREEEARLALEEARAESLQLKAWVRDHDLLGSYLAVVKSLGKQAREGNQAARMAQGTIPRWFAILPCDKPFELWKTTRTTWGDELGKVCLLKTLQLAWDYLYPMEKRLIELVQQELAEGRRLMLYIDQNDERSMGKRLQWVLQQANIASWILSNQMKPEDRQQAIIEAMSTGLDGKPAVTVAIVPYARVNEGINLQSVVDTIIWYEMALNLFMLEQASRRAWRLGKREEVRIYYMAYAGTAGHQKMRKLGGQSGAAASFAGEPARGTLIEEAGADRTTLARFSATVEAELLTDKEGEEEDPQTLLEVTDEEELEAAFARRAKEEREALGRGRTWLGAVDTLPERLPAFFTGPRRTPWGTRPTFRLVRVVWSVEPVTLVAAETNESVPVLPIVEAASSTTPVSSVSDTPVHHEAVIGSSTVPTQPAASVPEEIPVTLTATPRPPKHRKATAAPTLVFGNADHIQLVRQHRSKSGKESAKPAAKKPRVQVEMRDIPAVTLQAEEQPQLQQISTFKKKPKGVQSASLWDLPAEESQTEPSSVRVASPAPLLDPQQLVLW
jgi:hypothetical protein